MPQMLIWEIKGLAQYTVALLRLDKMADKSKKLE